MHTICPKGCHPFPMSSQCYFNDCSQRRGYPMNNYTRRHILGLIARLPLARLVIADGVASVAMSAARTAWDTKAATRQDAAASAAIFHVHRAAGLCPFPERIPSWTADVAARFLVTYTGTLLLVRNGIPVGFIGFVNY